MDLSQRQYEELERLFLRAQGLEGGEVEAIMEEADPALRPHLRRLVAPEHGAAFTDDAIVEQRARLDALLDLDLVDPETIGAFRIIRRVGEGGMGTVFEARQARPDRRVALKVLRSPLASADRVARFEREAQWLGRLHHPGIAQVFEVGVFDLGRSQQPYLAMEFVEGTDLITHAARAHLTLRARVELLAKVCGAVEHAHGAGVLHRDLKPENVLVDPYGQPKLLDFGISRSLNADGALAATLTSDGQILGTLGYMAPEQLDPEQGALGPHTDVYALGVLGFELLTGRRAFLVSGTSLSQALSTLATSEPRSPASVEPALRGDLDTILSKALERDPRRRYATAAALSADLWRHLDDRPIHARPPSTAYRVAKFVRRERALVRVLAVLVLGLVGTIGFAIDASRKGERASLAAARERESSSELERTLYAAESRLASGAATEPGGFGIVVRHVERWRERSGGAASPGWEFQWLEAIVSNPQQATPVHGRMYAVVEDRARERFVHVGERDVLIVPFDGDGEVRALPAAGRTPIDAAISPDGRALVTSFVGQRVELRDLEDDREVWSVEIADQPCTVEWHSGTDVIVCSTFDGPIHGLDPASGAVRWTEEAFVEWRGSRARLSPDGERLLVTAGTEVVLATVQRSGLEVEARMTLPEPVAVHAWSPDGRSFAFGAVSGRVGVVRVEGGAMAFLEKQCTDRVTHIAFSRDGALIAAASFDDSVAILDARRGRPVRRIRFDGENQQAVAWFDDTRLVVLGDQPVVTTWDIRVPSAIDRGWLMPVPVRYTVVTLERSDHVDTYDASLAGRVLRFSAEGAPPRVDRRGEAGQAIARTDDGSLVAKVADGILSIEGAGSDAPVRMDVGVTAPVRLEWSPGDEPRLLLADMVSLRVIDPDGDRAPEPLHTDSPTHPAPTWSADGASILFSAPTQHVKRIDPTTSEVLAAMDVGDEALSLALSPDGGRLAVGTQGSDVLLLDARTLEIQRVIEGHTEQVRGVAWSPDGRRLATGGHDGRVRVWEPSRGELMASIDVGERIGDLVWSADGSDLLVALVTGDLVRLSSRRSGVSRPVGGGAGG